MSSGLILNTKCLKSDADEFFHSKITLVILSPRPSALTTLSAQVSHALLWPFSKSLLLKGQHRCFLSSIQILSSDPNSFLTFMYDCEHSHLVRSGFKKKYIFSPVQGFAPCWRITQLIKTKETVIVCRVGTGSLWLDSTDKHHQWEQWVCICHLCGQHTHTLIHRDVTEYLC